LSSSLSCRRANTGACNASHSVEARLARWLFRVRDLSGEEALPPTQETLAQLIGVQRDLDRRPCPAAGGNDPLQPGLHRHYERL
jgi:hypothetical protein